MLNEQEWNKANSVKFRPIPNGRLLLLYPDGDKRIFDVWEYLTKNNLSKGYWKNLFDQNYFESVENVGAMASWDDESITIDGSMMFENSTPTNILTSSYTSLSMARITATPINGVDLYINDPRVEHGVPHILARVGSENKANFSFDGTLQNGSLEKDKFRKVVDFIKSHPQEILAAYEAIKEGLKPVLIK